MSLFFFSVLAQDSNPDQHSVLLAYENTRFKRSLIKEMQKQLEDRDVSVTVVRHSSRGLEIEESSQYSAIFITNSGVNSEIRPWIVEWLNENRDFNILLHTTQTRSWEPQTKVDAVTSASTVSDAEKLALKYVEKLIKLYSETPPESKDEEPQAQ